MIPTRVLLLLAVTVAASCATTTPQVQRVAYPDAEYAALAQTGTGVVRGQAFLKTRGGDVKTAAGEEIQLNPVTSYSQQWYEVGYLRRERLTAADPRYVGHIRTTVADAEGRFVFKAVPPGEYFVVARVVWEAATGYRGALRPQGGYVAKKVLVRDGDELDIIVTR